MQALDYARMSCTSKFKHLSCNVEQSDCRMILMGHGIGMEPQCMAGMMREKKKAGNNRWSGSESESRIFTSIAIHMLS